MKLLWRPGITAQKVSIVAVLFLVMYALGALTAKKAESVGVAALLHGKSENWGLGFGTEGKPPTGNASAEELKKYNAYFIGDTTQNTIYLTFDCGYENGNTEPILDALKKHDVKATFFVVGNFLETSPEIVKRMIAEGHTVATIPIIIWICHQFQVWMPLKRKRRTLKICLSRLQGHR